MAILHRAWTFDARAVAARIAFIVHEGDAAALRDAAHAIVAGLTDATAATLAELRFDPEWIDPPDEMSDRTVESIVIILASELGRAPSVAAHVVLRDVLAECGWSVAELDLLFYGRPLETMFDAVRDPQLNRCIAGINQYGGWIPRSEAASLRQRLSAVAEALPAKQAIQEARAMLDAARLRDADLFMILD